MGAIQATVAVCTYNGASRIADVLEALAIQTVDRGAWEMLVIDNASTDNTRAVCEHTFAKFLGVRCRVVFESRAGLSFARDRAAREAKGELLFFLDDDNIAAPNWVENAILAFGRHPKAGVIGGKVIPRWEVAPTPLAEAVAPFALAICDLGNQPMVIDAKGCGIVGAGMCLRTSLLREIYAREDVLGGVTGRTGSNLISGEDLAICVVARAVGWECWYIPEMSLEHCLPPGRMTKDYLLRLYEGIGRGQAAVRRVYDWKARTPLRFLIGLKDYLRWCRGRKAGPQEAPNADSADTDRDLHDLHQRLVYGRSMEAMRMN